MAADMFLSVTGARTGAINGEANAPDHLDEIEITGWSWGMSGSSAMGGTGASVRTALSELRITKNADRASTQLMSVMRTNEVLSEAKLSIRRAGVTPPTDYLTVTITNGRITSISIGTESSGSSNLVESLSFSFEEIEITYSEQESSGAAGAELSFIAQVHTD